LNLDFLKDFSKIYNLEFSVVLEELIKLIKKELKAESVFFKGGRLYESYTNLEGVYKERKIMERESRRGKSYTDEEKKNYDYIGSYFSKSLQH